jgi:hypothetical protein
MADLRDQAANVREVIGTLAHGDADGTSKPVKTGTKAVAYGATPAEIDAADRADDLSDRQGIRWVQFGHPNTVSSEFHFTAAQTDQALVTVGAGVKIIVSAASALLSAAGSATAGIRIGFATATLAAASSSGVNGIVLTHSGVAVGSGVVSDEVPVAGAANEDLRITCAEPTGGSWRVLIKYHTITEA